jgi:hypothetical protein
LKEDNKTIKSKFISGDVPLTISDHLRYFGVALREILDSLYKREKSLFYSPQKIAPPLINEPASPFRILQETFLREVLAPQIPIPAKILEIGCGRGQNFMIFQQMNITGSYLGIDTGRVEHGALDDNIMNSWQHTTEQSKQRDLQCMFEQKSISEFTNSHEKFNCVFSCSVLEHIDDISGAIGSMQNMISQEGVSAHTIPSPFSYFLYGPHGFRRFSGKKLKILFSRSERNCKIYALGGAFSYVTHLFFITLPLLIFKKDLRKTIPVLYTKLLYLSLRLDRFARFLHTGYGVVITAGNLK